MVFTAKDAAGKTEGWGGVSVPESIANKMESGQAAREQAQKDEAARAATQKQLKIQNDARRAPSFLDYQKAAVSTAVYPEAGTGSEKALAYCFALAAEEAGELNGKWAKFLRDGDNDTRNAIIKEMGDVLWALANLANEIDLALSEVARLNTEKLASRQQRGVLGGSGDDR
jgi:NTP pyrophosphatase (non-canonical NTP hydrolase)